MSAKRSAPTRGRGGGRSTIPERTPSTAPGASLNGEPPVRPSDVAPRPNQVASTKRSGASQQSRIDEEDLRAFCDFHEAYVSRNIQLGDAKAGVVLVAVSGLILLLLKDGQYRLAVREAAGSPPWLLGGDFSLLNTVASGALLLCSLAVAISFWVLKPRIKAARLTPAPGNVTFWGDVAAHPPLGKPGDYPESVRRLSHRDVLTDRLEHSYQLSRICSVKMRWLERSMYVSMAGTALAVVWFVWFAVSVSA